MRATVQQSDRVCVCVCFSLRALWGVAVAHLGTGPFLEKVDWKNWGLPDYPLIIKKPMDLGLIQVQPAPQHTTPLSGSLKTTEAVVADKAPNPHAAPTVQRNLDNNVYKTPQDWAKDVHLVWDNCMVYNKASIA